MPLSESLLQTYGALQLPASANTADGTLTSLDPGRDQLLALFKAAINSELGSAWAAVVGPTRFGNEPAPLPVMDTFPGRPIEQTLTQRKAGWPLLCLHRDGRGVGTDFSIEQDVLTQPWKLHYIVGPLDIVDFRKVGDIGQAVFKVCRLVARQRKHKAYQDGALQFFHDTGRFASLEVTGYEGLDQVGFAGDRSTTFFWACEVDLTTTELSDYVEGSEESGLDGADLRLHLQSDDGLLQDAVLWSSDAPPVDE